MTGDSKQRRGFAAMDESKQRQIASKGGKAAHRAGTAHQFTSDEARVAGRKGGTAHGKKGFGGELGGTAAGCGGQGHSGRTVPQQGSKSTKPPGNRGGFGGVTGKSVFAKRHRPIMHRLMA